MIIRTEAVVLRSMKYSETSRIVTLFTREKGKISVLAKGARQTKSRFGSSLQPMSYTQVVFYYKASRGLQTLTESSHVVPFHHIARDLARISTGLRVVELVNAVMQQEEQNPLVFNLLLQVLHRLDAAPEHAENLLPYFQLKLSAVLGFAPSIDREDVLRLSESGGLLLLDTGEILPYGETQRAGRGASREALRAFAICARAELDAVMRLTLAPDVFLELDMLVEDFLRYHLEDAYPSRSSRVVEQMRSSMARAAPGSRGDPPGA